MFQQECAKVDLNFYFFIFRLKKEGEINTLRMGIRELREENYHF